MAVRIRKDGRVWCAALNPEEDGDMYIGDGLHYYLSVEMQVLVTTDNDHHMKTGGEWWWVGRIPEGIVISDVYLSTSD